MDSKSWPLRYRCSAPTTELSSHLGAGHINQSCFHIFLPSSYIWSFICPSPSTGILRTHNVTNSQMVGHCTGVAEGMGSNPVQAWTFCRLFQNCLSCVYNCDVFICKRQSGVCTLYALVAGLYWILVSMLPQTDHGRVCQLFNRLQVCLKSQKTWKNYLEYLTVFFIIEKEEIQRVPDLVPYALKFILTFVLQHCLRSRMEHFPFHPSISIE